MSTGGINILIIVVLCCFMSHCVLSQLKCSASLFCVISLCARVCLCVCVCCSQKIHFGKMEHFKSSSTHSTRLHITEVTFTDATQFFPNPTPRDRSAEQTLNCTWTRTLPVLCQLIHVTFTLSQRFTNYWLSYIHRCLPIRHLFISANATRENTKNTRRRPESAYLCQGRIKI